MALNDDEYGVIPMEISTDDDTDESKERRKNNKQSVLDQNQQNYHLKFKTLKTPKLYNLKINLEEFLERKDNLKMVLVTMQTI